MANGIVSFTDTSITGPSEGGFSDHKVEIFKPKQGETYRIYFPTAEAFSIKRHWNQEAHKYFACLESDGYCPVCVAATTPGSTIRKGTTAYGANIIVYDTDANGNVKEPLDGKVMFWTFSYDKFNAIRTIATTWGGINKVDMIANCYDQQFCKMNIQPAPNCYYLSNPDFKAKMDAKWETDRLQNYDAFMAKRLNVLELASAFGIPQSSIPESVVQACLQSQSSAPSSIPSQAVSDDELPFKGPSMQQQSQHVAVQAPQTAPVQNGAAPQPVVPQPTMHPQAFAQQSLAMQAPQSSAPQSTVSPGVAPNGMAQMAPPTPVPEVNVSDIEDLNCLL